MLKNIEFEIKWVLEELIQEKGPQFTETDRGKALVEKLTVLEAAQKQACRMNNVNMQD